MHQEQEMIFYFNTLTNETTWNKPENFNDIGDHLISKNEMDSILNEFDEFTFSKHIDVSSKNFDQSSSVNSKDYFGDEDERESVKIEEKFNYEGNSEGFNNFTILTESVHNHRIDLGSGALGKVNIGKKLF